MGIDVAGASTQMSARQMERSLEAASSPTRKSLPIKMFGLLIGDN